MASESSADENGGLKARPAYVLNKLKSQLMNHSPCLPDIAVVPGGGGNPMGNCKMSGSPPF